MANHSPLSKRKIDNIEIGRTGLKIHEIEKIDEDRPDHLYWLLTGNTRHEGECPQLVHDLMGLAGEAFSQDELLQMIDTPSKAPKRIAKLLKVSNEESGTNHEDGDYSNDQTILARGGN